MIWELQTLSNKATKMLYSHGKMQKIQENDMPQCQETGKPKCHNIVP